MKKQTKNKMMSKAILCILFAAYMMLQAVNVSAQSIGAAINATGAAAAQSAMLDVSATNQGVLIPRVTLTGTTDVTTIPSPANSLMVFNTTAAGSGATAVVVGFYYWDAANSRWTALGGSSGVGGSSAKKCGYFTSNGY